jgi:hypothetical protein
MATGIRIDTKLILAAEDCPEESFEDIHFFSSSDKRIVSKLLAHGPVLLRGGRGCGKSALMLHAYYQTKLKDSPVFGVYLSMRHLDLLRSEGVQYQKCLCEKLVAAVSNEAGTHRISFDPSNDIISIQEELSLMARAIGKRNVIFFDDAAHIGREAPLNDFFDMFRTFSNNFISCKASIYPGVTRFGTRFDVFNDATVIDVSRNEELSDYVDPFVEVIRKRYPDDLSSEKFSSRLSMENVAELLARAVVGNMTGFVFACNALSEEVGDQRITLDILSKVLKELGTNYYWPLIEELKPKLGPYEIMIEPSIQIAELILKHCAERQRRSFIVHRDIIQALMKPFEMLEYTGFISRREASRGMKSGGRGARYVASLCPLLEKLQPSRLTMEVYENWMKDDDEPVELHRRSGLLDIRVPENIPDKDLSILDEDIEAIIKSPAYPYGLTSAMKNALHSAGFHSIRSLAEASYDELLRVDSIGHAKATRIRNVVAQAIWM